MAREQLAHGRQLVFRAGGASMWPMIRPNTELTVSPCEPAALTVGRCVLAIHGDGLVVHRIVTVDERRVLVKGDNNRCPDGWYAREEILGELPSAPFDRLFAWLSRVPGQPVATLWAIWRRLF